MTKSKLKHKNPSILDMANCVYFACVNVADSVSDAICVRFRSKVHTFDDDAIHRTALLH